VQTRCSYCRFDSILVIYRRSRLLTIAEADGTSMDPNLLHPRCIVWVRRNISLQQPQTQPHYNHKFDHIVPQSAAFGVTATESHHPPVHQSTTTNSNQTATNFTTDDTGSSTCFTGTQLNRPRRIVHVRRTNSFHYGKPLRSQKPAISSTTDYQNCNMVITLHATTVTLLLVDSTVQTCRTYHRDDDQPQEESPSNEANDHTELTDTELAPVQPNLPCSTTAIS